MSGWSLSVAQEEEERVHFDRLAARRELNKLAEMEEAKYMEQQEEYNELVQQDLNGSIESFPPAPTAAERMARKLQQIDVNEMESALAHFYEDVVEFDSDQDVSYLTMRSRPPQALRAAKSGTLEESSQDPLLASELFGNNAYFRLSLTGKEDLKQNRLAMSDTILEEERIRKEKEKMQRERSDKFLQMGLAPRPRPQYSRRNYYSSYYSYDTDEDEYEDDRRRGGDQKKDNAKPTPPLYPFDEIRMFGFSKYDREEKVAELEIAGDLTGSAKGLSSSEPSGTAKNGKSGGWGKVVKPPSDAGRKVFLGGVKFDDITSASKSEKWPESKMKEIRSLRIAELKALCATFGTISSWEEKWDEGYAFVTYVRTLGPVEFLNSLFFGPLGNEGRGRSHVPHALPIRPPQGTLQTDPRQGVGEEAGQTSCPLPFILRPMAEILPENCSEEQGEEG